MGGLILRRLASMVPLFLLVSFGVFSLTLLIPGDPAVTMAGDNPTEERVAQIREILGLDKPVPVQYLDWLGGILKGDFGTSLFTGQEVFKQITQRLPVTLSLTFGALCVAMVLGITGGVVAATNRGTWIDKLVVTGAAASVALPGFMVAILLLFVFSVKLGWFPAIGFTGITKSPIGWLRSITLPSIALGMTASAVVARQLRSQMVDILEQDYVRTARAKGMPQRVVVLKHALKNAMIPVVTILGLQVSTLMGGTVVVESVFGTPGLGSLAVNGVFSHDMPVIQGVVVVAVVVVLLVNLLVDILYGYLNPKVRAT